MNVAETERLELRRFRKEDAEAVLSFLGNAEVMRFSLHGPYNLKQCENFVEWCLERYHLKGYGLYAIVLKDSLKLVGYCGFYDQVIDGVDEVELGYRLHPNVWNCGVATEAAKAAMEYGFETLGFNRLISIIEAENTASIRVAEKNGFTHEKNSLFKESVPVRIYSFTKNDGASLASD